MDNPLLTKPLDTQAEIDAILEKLAKEELGMEKEEAASYFPSATSEDTTDVYGEETPNFMPDLDLPESVEELLSEADGYGIRPEKEEKPPVKVRKEGIFSYVELPSNELPEESEPLQKEVPEEKPKKNPKPATKEKPKEAPFGNRLLAELIPTKGEQGKTLALKILILVCILIILICGITLLATEDKLGQTAAQITANYDMVETMAIIAS